MTSRVEGFSIAVVEAQRSGCVPVAFNSYPVAQELIKDGKNGVLVKPFDEDEYANQLMTLMRNDELLINMRKEGIKKSKEYTIDKIMSQWIKLYHEVTEI